MLTAGAEDKLYTFVASTAAEALKQIRAELGPEAVVVNVRQVAGSGLSRLWQSKRIEVIACLPEKQEEAAESITIDPLLALKAELAEIRQRLATPVVPAPMIITQPAMAPEPIEPAKTSRGWDLAVALEQTGLLPRYARQLADSINTNDLPPVAQLNSVQDWLRNLWRSRSAPQPAKVHVFIGPAGSGKTTALSKWLAQSVLIENRLSRVYRLDGLTANTAESLSVFAEVLGVPLERFRDSGEVPNPAELIFVDLPGIDWRNPESLKELAQHLAFWRGAQVHLVLNGAYDANLLLTQARAFSSLPVSDIVFTHLDEETRWGKLWNVWLGTNYTVSRLSAGQNLPGEFWSADADLILKRQFLREST